jgi:hypothetical protein
MGRIITGAFVATSSAPQATRFPTIKIDVFEIETFDALPTKPPFAADILAKLDTGASSSLIDVSLAQTGHLKRAGEMKGFGIGGEKTLPTYFVLFQPRGTSILFRTYVSGVELSHGDRTNAVNLGMDFIQHFNLTLTYPDVVRLEEH